MNGFQKISRLIVRIRKNLIKSKFKDFMLF